MISPDERIDFKRYRSSHVLFSSNTLLAPAVEATSLTTAAVQFEFMELEMEVVQEKV